MGEVLDWLIAIVIGLGTVGLISFGIWAILVDYSRIDGKCPNCNFRASSTNYGKTELNSCNGIKLPYKREQFLWLVPFEESDAYASQLILSPFCQADTPKFEPYCLSCGLIPITPGTDSSPYLGWVPKSKPKKG